MKIAIEFYRIRKQDDAHAVVGREALDVADLDAAIEMARPLALSLDTPQRPDALVILGESSRTFHSCAFDAALEQRERLSP